MVCPHTATAVAAVRCGYMFGMRLIKITQTRNYFFKFIRTLKLPSAKTICLATAHPAKFEEAVTLALEGTTAPEVNTKKNI